MVQQTHKESGVEALAGNKCAQNMYSRKWAWGKLWRNSKWTLWIPDFPFGNTSFQRILTGRVDVCWTLTCVIDWGLSDFSVAWPDWLQWLSRVLPSPQSFCPSSICFRGSQLVWKLSVIIEWPQHSSHSSYCHTLTRECTIKRRNIQKCMPRL